MRLLGCLSGLLISVLCVWTPLRGDDSVVSVGVLAHRGKAAAMERWTETAVYLSEKVPGFRFVMVPVNLEEMADAVQHGRIQFALTNPGNYVDIEARFGASRIATLQTREGRQSRVRYGAVIVANAGNPAIQSMDDLKGKSFMAVSAEAFGGFQMAWRELKDSGIDPFSDFSQLRFAGFPQDKIIMSVLDGEVDAATVRAETLARMVESGLVQADDIRVLNKKLHPGSPFDLSTRLYPEWPFATLRDTPRQLATSVAQALLSMPTGHKAALVSRTSGWTVPLDYSPVHELMRTLQIGPYEVLRQTSLLAISRRYAWWIFAAGLVLLGLMFINGHVSRTNHRLKVTERELRNEIVERERSQQALAQVRDTLEDQVSERTEILKKTNRALDCSRVALRELVRITGAPDLNHEQRLDRLLDTGRAYYRVPVAVLASIGGGRQKVYKVSGDRDRAPVQAGPLDERCASRLVERNGEPLDIPDLEQHSDSISPCLRKGWKSYLGAAVLVEGKVHCTLEFAGSEARNQVLSQWDHELLKVMAQWIGDELERQIACEAQQQHQAEVARVSRMSTIGEMAASLAHELNQPLTGAINYTNGCLRLLQDTSPDRGKLVEGMQHAVEGATLAAEIIRNIREFVQKGDARRGPVDLNQAVGNVAVLAGPEASRQGVEMILDLSEGLPVVEGNLIQLEQVILNLVRNGIDAMDGVEPAGRKLVVSTCQTGTSVQVTVTDLGEGIDANSLSKIFNTFYTTKADGMGIGLSISRSIVEAHQGRIRARSLPGAGAEFRFELPVAGLA